MYTYKRNPFTNPICGYRPNRRRRRRRRSKLFIKFSSEVNFKVKSRVIRSPAGWVCSGRKVSPRDYDGPEFPKKSRRRGAPRPFCRVRNRGNPATKPHSTRGRRRNDSRPRPRIFDDKCHRYNFYFLFTPVRDDKNAGRLAKTFAFFV